jgi:retron-type reverse transcriptase
MIAINQKINNFYLSRLILKQLRAGYIHMSNFADSNLQNKIGTPQGSILSPLFANIMLNQLDNFIVEKMMKTYDNSSIQSKWLHARHETTLKSQQ